MIRDIYRTYRQAFLLFLRTRTKPMTIEQAEEKKLFWAKVYACVGVVSLFYCTYATHSKGINFNYRQDIPRERAAVEKLMQHPGKVTVYKGFEKVDEYKFVPPEVVHGKGEPIVVYTKP